MYVLSPVLKYLSLISRPLCHVSQRERKIQGLHVATLNALRGLHVSATFAPDGIVCGVRLWACAHLVPISTLVWLRYTPRHCLC